VPPPPLIKSRVSVPSLAPIEVSTDLLDVEINPRGGTVTRASLRAYPTSVKNRAPFELLGDDPTLYNIAQSGLIGADSDLAPTHEAVYQVEKQSYQLADGQNTLVVGMVWTNPDGIKVVKRFELTRGSYLIKVTHEVINNSAVAWVGRDYHQLQRTKPDPGSQSRLLPTFTGAAFYTPEEKYRKIAFDDFAADKYDIDVTGGWISLIQHYFLSAWVPPVDSPEHFFTKVLKGDRYLIGMYGSGVTVAPGQTQQLSSELWVGPKLQNSLSEVAAGLDLTVDYGWLTVIAQPLFWLLTKLHGLADNWGWAIILLTILIKLAFFKLSETSYKSMANMRRMGPKLQQLKQRYGDDKQRLNQAMMEVYKKEKINPLGGCLPILVQIPVFIALYWVLLESVELRDAPFILWIHSLSVKDPYYILPVIMGISMFVQQKLNPAPPDPMQAKIMMTLPFVFTAFFAFFPAGLVLYWVVNNLLSISQQWYITRRIEKAAK